MKAVDRRQQEVLLRTWKHMLEKLNEIGPASASHDDLQAFGHVKDYILDQIEHTETVLHNARSLRHRVNSLPPKDNAPDNPLRSGVDNA